MVKEILWTCSCVSHIGDAEENGAVVKGSSRTRTFGTKGVLPSTSVGPKGILEGVTYIVLLPLLLHCKFQGAQLILEAGDFLFFPRNAKSVQEKAKSQPCREGSKDRDCEVHSCFCFFNRQDR